MKENTDKQPPAISLENAEIILRTKPEIPGTVRSLLGSTNVKALVDLLTSETVVAVDAYILAGIFDKAAARQYVQLVPDHEETLQCCYGIAQKMFEHLRSGLVRRYEKPSKECSLDDIYNSIASCCRAFPYATEGWQRFILNITFSHLLSLIFCYIYDQIGDHNRQQFIAYCIKLDDNPRQHTARQQSFPGTQCFFERYYHTCTLNDYGYAANLQAYLSVPPLPDTANLKDICMHDMAKVRNLKEYRAIYPHLIQVGPVRVAIHRDQPENLHTFHPDICDVEIILDPRVVFSFPRMLKQGDQTLYVQHRKPGILSVKLDKAGDLVFSASAAFTLQNLLGDKNYQCLRYRVITAVHEYLAAKDEDIPDLFAKADPVVQVAETRVAMSDTLSTTDIVSTNTLQDSDTAEVLPSLDLASLVPPLDVQDTEHLAEVAPTGKKRQPRIHRSLKFNEVKNALERVVGKPRQRGSHFMYQSRKGGTVPFPMHKGDSINPHLLVHVLEGLGVSVAEFLNNL